MKNKLLCLWHQLQHLVLAELQPFDNARALQLCEDKSFHACLMIVEDPLPLIIIDLQRLCDLQNMPSEVDCTPEINVKC